MIRSNAIQYNRYKAFPNNVLLKKYTILILKYYQINNHFQKSLPNKCKAIISS